MKIKGIIAAIILILCNTVILAAKTDSIYSEKNTNITVTRSQPEFLLKLKSNPTTGYSWFLREYPANFITPVKHSFKAPNNALIGAPGVELWVFRVKRTAFQVPQQLTVHMIYARPWEKEKSGVEVVFRIHVR